MASSVLGTKRSTKDRSTAGCIRSLALLMGLKFGAEQVEVYAEFPDIRECAEATRLCFCLR